MNVLGIHASFNALTHDPSASLFIDGKLVFSIEEERLNRLKTSSGVFPERAIAAALLHTGLSIRDIDILAVDGSTYTGMEYKVRRYMFDVFGHCPEISIQHHAKCHTAAGFYASTFSEALCISFDGIGDRVSTYVELRSDEGCSSVVDYGAESSLGFYYTIFTNFLGFKSIEGEYKVMGMAAYGEPKYDLSEILTFNETTGHIIFNLEYYCEEYYTSIWEPSQNESKLINLLGVCPRRHTEKEFKQEHFDLAASVQSTFTQVYIDFIKYQLKNTGQDRLVLSGGCALNCLANKELLKLTRAKTFVFPAASDRGLSIGAGLLASEKLNISCERITSMYLGPEYKGDLIKASLKTSGLDYEYVENIAEEAAEAIVNGFVVAWHQGRSEFGPRALGNRSILASAITPGSKDLINKKIKFRETFRPFAPAILYEDFIELFGVETPFPYMTYTLEPKNAQLICEAVNVDGTARVQTVAKDHESLVFRTLLEEIKKRQGCGVVLNTSFNLAGEPIVETPTDAIRTFVSSDLDILFIGNYRVTKRRLC